MDSVNSVGRMPKNCYSRPTCAKPAVEQPSTSGSTAQSTAVNMSQSRSSDITLVTAEGDTVTLSASQTKEISFETYSSKGQSTDSDAVVSAEVRKSSEFSMTIDGDLNREELKDIRKAIRTLFKAERDILKGHDERATERTTKLAELDQIASIDAKMEFRQTVSVTQTTVETPPAENPTSAEPPAIETPAVNNDTAVPPETQQLPEPMSQSVTASVPSVESPVQHFIVTTFDKQQQILFQYLWDGGRPIAVQGPGAPTLNSSPAAA